MDRLKLIVAWEAFVLSACAFAVGTTMVVQGIAWPMGYLIAAGALGLLAVSQVALVRLRADRHRADRA